MPLPSPTAVLLDMDGTAVRHRDPRVLHLLETLDDWCHVAARLWPFVRRGPPRLWAHRLLHRIRRKGVEEILEPCPGLFPFLAALKRRGIPCALVSNGLGEGYGHEVLEAFGLGPYFAMTLFRENAPRSKPHPDCLRAALAAMGLSEPSAAEVIWVVGDRSKDIRAALALAEDVRPARVVPVAYALSAARAALAAGLSLDNIVFSYADLLRVVERGT
jgi:phosphoglycolate phosphatase